jgi:ferritin-like metal-binding protein YciE
MAPKDPKDVFLMLLSDVRRSTERGTKFYEEFGELAQDPQVKEALESRAFISQRTLEKLDQCFKLINEKPVELSGRVEDVAVEDFRKELREMKSPEVRHLYILAKLIHLTHFRIGEYVALVAAADISGHFGVGVLLESCLGEKIAFVERTRRLMRHFAETRILERMAAHA